MLEDPLVSVIIPCKEIDNYAKECVRHCRQLDYGNFEIILLPDSTEEKMDEVKIIPTGPATPGMKRNIGISNARGEFCAFIDSDAYPRKGWLRNAIKYFGDPVVVAVGGPGLTPKEDSCMQRASGYVLSSFMVGSISNRYKAERVYESDDIHSCNLIAQKAALNEVGGWNEDYWPGEDTLLCLALKKLGKKLVEASDVAVNHHRRPLFSKHLRQVSRFGLHRGFFLKRFQGNSFKLTYFAPSLLVLSLFVGVLGTLISSLFLNVLLLVIVGYLLLSFVAALLGVEEVKLILLVWLGIIATHVVYGLSFLTGLIKRDLQR